MEITMSNKIMLAKIDVCKKYEIKAPKLEYHIKKESFPKGEIINGMRYFSEAEIEKYAEANKTFKKPSHKEMGKAEAIDYNLTNNNVWVNVAPEPWYIRHKLLVRALLTAIVAGTAAAIVSSVVG